MSDWKEYKLSEVCSLITDGKHGDCQNETNSGYFFLSAKDVRDGKLIYDNARQIAKSDFEETHRRTDLAPGDILITNSGTIGRMAIATDISETRRTTFQKSVAILKPKKENVTSIFLYYLLLYNFRGLVELAGGTTQQNLLLGDLREFEITIPDFEDQKSIASILSSLDDKIDLLHRQNKTLEALAETLFRQWFVEEAEEGWASGRLGNILESIESGSRPKGGIDPSLKDGIPSIGAENINGLGVYDFSKTKFITPDFFKSMTRGLIKDYDVLIYKDGAYVGRKGMFADGFPYDICAVNEHVFILRANNRANQFFLYFLLQEDELAQLNANSAQPGLNQEAMKSLEIIIPPQELINQFEEKVKSLIDKIFFNCNQIRTLSRLRDTLLPKLMSGEVRVKDADRLVKAKYLKVVANS